MISINLAWCCDDNYAQHLGVSLCSALEHLPDHGCARVFIICSKFGIKNRKKISSIADRYKVKLQFIKASLSDFKGLKISHHITPAAYFRIALPDLLPQDVSKVLYLDCDLIVQDDLSKLFTIDIAEAPLGAIPEADQHGHCVPRETLGIAADAVYFNSGVMLLNITKWRKEKLSNKLFAFIRDNPDRLRYWDQDALNIFFHTSFKPLPYRWNFSIQHLNKPELYNDNEGTGIIHFIGEATDKPWHPECAHPLKSEYYRFLRLTPWRSFKPEDSLKIGFLKKLYNVKKDLCCVFKAWREGLHGPVLNKKMIAGCHARYTIKEILIRRGLIKNPKRERLGVFSVYFSEYAFFLEHFREFFLCKEYSFKPSCHDPVIIDCGSEIGISMLFYKLLYPTAKIIIYNPNLETTYFLKKNIQTNHLTDVHVCASFSSIIESADLLKINLRGREYALLNELEESGHLFRIKIIKIKYHSDCQHQSMNFHNLVDKLGRNNFSVQISQDDPDCISGCDIFISAYNKNTKL